MTSVLMQDAPSLLAKQRATDVRVTDRMWIQRAGKRWLPIWTVLVCVLSPRMTAAQCPPQLVSGSVTIGDGSIVMGCPDGQVSVFITQPGNTTYPQCLQCARGPFPPGAITVDLMVGAPFTGAFGASCHLNDHYMHPPGSGSYECHWENNCEVCSGSFDIPLYSRYGGLEGRVTFLPSGQPAPGVLVRAKPVLLPEAFSLTAPTDAQGNYKFNYALHGCPACNYDVATFDANNWGLLLDGSGDGFLTRSYEIRASNPTMQSALAVKETRSSTRVVVDLELQDMEPPDIRSCPSVGQPVSVSTGNAYLDQTDAVVPGAAAAGLSFVRAYNSANVQPGRYGMFGPGWSTFYEKRLSLHSANVIMLRGSDGVVSYFQDISPSTDGTFEASVPYTSESRIVRQQEDQSYVREFRTGGSERYEPLQGGGQGGRLTAIVDSVGNAINLSYDPATGQLTTVTDQAGDPAGRRQLTFDYPNVNTITLSGLSGLIATYTLADGLLDSVQYADSEDDGSDPDGGYSFEYHPAVPPTEPRRLWKVRDADGTVIETHEYDAQGRATTSEVSGGIDKFTLVYEPLKTTVTDANGHVTTYEYSNVWGMKRPTKTTGPCASCGGGTGSQTWTYDGKGRVLSHRDAEGYETTYTYDQTTGDLLSETRVVDLTTGATHVTSYAYWPDESAGKGRIHTRTAPNSAVTTYEYNAAPPYDAPGPTKITEQIEATRFRETNITYTPQGESGAGKVKFVDDPLQKRWEYRYFPNGDLEWIRDPLGNQTRFSYDLMGRQKQVIRPTLLPVPGTPADPPIQEAETTYDTLGRVSRVKNTDDNTFTRFTYDGGGRRRTVLDALNRTTEYRYDVYGRVWKVIDAEEHPTEYGYDAASNLTSIKDARGKITTFVPDSSNRVERVCYPSDAGEPTCQRYEQFTYDSIGRVKTRRDRRGALTTFTYDGLGRLTSKAYSDGTAPATYAYDQGAMDQKGRLTSAVAAPIALTWTYDLAGEARTATRTKTITPIGSRTISYTYDDAGHRKTLTLEGQLLMQYNWEDRGLLESIQRSPDRTYQFTYDTASRRKRMDSPNGVTTAYGYDPRSRLASLAATGQSAITAFSYPEYDLVDNRVRRDSAIAAPPERYSYDPVYRLKTVERSQTTVESYGYDEVGNRTTSHDVPPPALWSYSNRNELLQKGTAASYSYDLNGNLAQKTEGGNTWTYEWNAENRLTRVRRNGVAIVTHAYDALGRRAERFVRQPQNQRHDYIYDGEDIVREDYSDPFTEGPLREQNQHLYVHGPGIDEPLEVEHDDGEVWFYHADGLGSIVRVTTSAGTEMTAMRRQYDAFGNLQVGAIEQGYAYTGREWDAESALYYYRARYYDPQIGRFINEDPIRWKDGINFYVYAKGRPTALTDPMGLCVCPASKCCEEIAARKERVHELLDALEGRPARPDAGSGPIGGSTTCSGHQPDVDYSGITNSTPPCLRGCAIAHEERHAEQCRRFGADYLGYSMTAAERAAYMQELGCLILEERRQCCG